MCRSEHVAQRKRIDIAVGGEAEEKCQALSANGGEINSTLPKSKVPLLFNLT
jgi:hypothetical protein